MQGIEKHFSEHSVDEPEQYRKAHQLHDVKDMR
jgi:hypothetical protein